MLKPLLKVAAATMLAAATYFASGGARVLGFVLLIASMATATGSLPIIRSGFVSDDVAASYPVRRRILPPLALAMMGAILAPAVGRFRVIPALCVGIACMLLLNAMDPDPRKTGDPSNAGPSVGAAANAWKPRAAILNTAGLLFLTISFVAQQPWIMLIAGMLIISAVVMAILGIREGKGSPENPQAD